MLKFGFMELRCICTSIDQICVEVFEKTIRGTEMIDHSFEKKFYGVWNRLCLFKKLVRGLCRALRACKVFL